MNRLPAAMFLVLACAGAQAQPYPSKPIRMVVPSTPVGRIDRLAPRLAFPLTVTPGPHAEPGIPAGPKTSTPPATTTWLTRSATC